jgi:predicted metal-dependent phosphoesterase TrpH
VAPGRGGCPLTSRYGSEPADPIIPSAPSTIDLHTHTLRSDGVLQPAELVRQAFDAGVRLLAITDHDNLAGYREMRTSGVLPQGLELLPGVEINAVVDRRDELWEGELHILGFGMDADDDAFEAALAKQRGERHRRFDRILVRLREIGMPVDAELAPVDVGDDDALGRPTVARALIRAGYAVSVEDAFQRWLAWGMPAYVPRNGLGPVAAIGAIRAAGGLPVLAHFREAPQRAAIMRELVEHGLGGLEVYYRSFDRATVAAVGEVADALGLVRTGGSDYHGDLGPYAETHAELWVPPEVGVTLKSTIQSRPNP